MEVMISQPKFTVPSRTGLATVERTESDVSVQEACFMAAACTLPTQVGTLRERKRERGHTAQALVMACFSGGRKSVHMNFPRQKRVVYHMQLLWTTRLTSSGNR